MEFEQNKSKVELCLGCGRPTQCIRDCGCPAGTYEMVPNGKPRGCDRLDCEACRAFDPSLSQLKTLLKEVEVPVKETLEDRFKRIAQQSRDFEEFRNRAIAATPEHLRRSIKGQLVSFYAEHSAKTEKIDSTDEDPYVA